MLKLCAIVVVIVVCGELVSSQTTKYDCSGPPPAFKRPEECCTYPRLIDDSVIDQCKTKHGLTGGKPTGKGDWNKLACAAECAFNQTGLMANGNIDRAKLAQVFTSKMNGDPALTPIVSNAITTCLKEADDKNNSKPKSDRTPSASDTNCNGATGGIFWCINKNIALNCPTPSSDADCIKIKEFITQCPNIGRGGRGGQAKPN